MGHGTVVKANGKLLIAGTFQEAAAGERFDVINPANPAVVGQAARGTEEDAKEAVEAAREARKRATEWGFPGGREAGSGEDPP